MQRSPKDKPRPEDRGLRTEGEVGASGACVFRFLACVVERELSGLGPYYTAL
jgi:hypothetical protein